MTSLAAEAATPAGVPPPAIARFTGERRAFRWMMMRGALLQVVTLGIYRFWLTTEMRRFLWANTEVDGDSLDYTGTAMELLIGFLIALAILVPIYVLFFIASLELGLYSQIAGVAGFLILTAFGQYALYRARRYRLTRTVYRGIRFHQDGSAFAYTARTIAWALPVLLTLGLAYPFAQANLERYKLRHTLYGDLRGTFTQSGTRLFLRGILMWLVVVGPLVAAVVLTVADVNWPALLDGLAADAFDDIDEAAAAHPGLARLLVIVPSTFSYTVVMALLLYPVFQGMVLKWWLSGLRFGDIAVTTSLRKRQIYAAYVRFVLLALLIAATLAVLVAITVLGFGVAVPGLDTIDGGATPYGIMAASVVFYLTVVMAIWVCWQVAVRLAMWRITVNSLTLTNFAALSRVRASGDAASAVGEGLADALGAGGF